MKYETKIDYKLTNYANLLEKHVSGRACGDLLDDIWGKICPHDFRPNNLLITSNTFL